MLYLLGIESHIRALQASHQREDRSALLYLSHQSGSFHLREDGTVFYGTNLGEHVFEGFQGTTNFST